MNVGHLTRHNNSGICNVAVDVAVDNLVLVGSAGFRLYRAGSTVNADNVYVGHARRIPYIIADQDQWAQ